MTAILLALAFAVPPESRVPLRRLEALSNSIVVEAEVLSSDLEQLAGQGFLNVALPDARLLATATELGLTVTVPASAVPKEEEFDWDRVFLNVDGAEDIPSVRAKFPSATLVSFGPAPFETPDKNVVEVLGFRQPALFFDQGGPGYRDIVQLPYPSSSQVVTELIALADENHRKALSEYGKARWGYDRIRRTLKDWADWSRAHHQPVVVRSFDIDRGATRSDRNRLVGDIAAALRDLNLGRQVGAYLFPKGPFSGAVGARKVDNQWISALGLRKS